MNPKKNKIFKVKDIFCIKRKILKFIKNNNRINEVSIKFERGVYTLKKLLLATSAALLLALSSGIAGASAAETKITPAASQALNYTVTLKVGESYQLAYGRQYTYYKSGFAKDSFGVSSSGLLTAYSYNFQVLPWEDYGVINVVDANGRDIEEVHVRIIQ